MRTQDLKFFFLPFCWHSSYIMQIRELTERQGETLVDRILLWVPISLVSYVEEKGG